MLWEVIVWRWEGEKNPNWYPRMWEMPEPWVINQESYKAESRAWHKGRPVCSVIEPGEGWSSWEHWSPDGATISSRCRCSIWCPVFLCYSSSLWEWGWGCFVGFFKASFFSCNVFLSCFPIPQFLPFPSYLSTHPTLCSLSLSPFKQKSIKNSSNKTPPRNTHTQRHQKRNKYK